MGGYDPEGAGCWQFARWSNWPPGLTPTAGIDNSMLLAIGKKYYENLFHDGNHVEEFSYFKGDGV